MCNNAKGVSFGRGTFKFVPGKWHKIKLSLVLNDVGRSNGYVELRVDDQLVTSWLRPDGLAQLKEDQC